MKRKFSIHRVFSIQFGLKALIFRICTKDFFRVTHKVMGLICGGIALTINGVFLPQAQSSISLRLRFACNGFFNFFVVAIVVFLSLGFSSNQSVSIWFGSTFIENSHFG